MNGKILSIVGVVLVIVGGWLLLSVTPAQAPSSETPLSNQMPVVGSTTPEMIVEDAPQSITIEYTDQGFTPSSITVTTGARVMFINKSSKDMWPASAMHPSHSVYSGTTLSQHCPDTAGTAFDACTPTPSGNSYSFTFNKAGTWKYHDHIDASKFGTVIVTATP